MLGKKETVQKTFRLDSKINENFEVLSEILERTQNDLANVSIQNLLEENSIWLAHNIFVDYAYEYFANAEDTEFEIDGVFVKIKYINDETIELSIVIKNNNEICDSYKINYNSSNREDEQKLKEKLRELYCYINPNCKEIKEYLKEINNYK